MTNWKMKLSTTLGEYIGRDFLKRASDFTNELENWTSRSPLNARIANPADEDEYMKEYNSKNRISVPPHKPIMPLQRDVSSWSKKDLDSVMRSQDYQFDRVTQKKVQSYFEWKYPGKQRLDATGRPY